MTTPKPTICIIGAGLTGLVCARELSRSGFSVRVVEEQSTAGGMLTSMRLGHEYIETIPHHVRKSDKKLIRLFEELGLGDKLEWFDSYWYGRVSRRKLGYLSGGFHGLVSALTQEITDHGGLIYYGYTTMDITAIPTEPEQISGTISSRERHNAKRYQISCILADCSTVKLESDLVLFTGSCRNFAHITHELPLATEYRDALMDVTYQANICLMLLMKTQFTGCFSRPLPFAAPFQKIIEHTNLVGKRRYGGHVLFLSGSFSTSHPLWTESDAEVFKIFLKHLQQMSPTTTRQDILTWRLSRTRYALPVNRASEDLFSPLPGLYLSSLAMVTVEDDKTDEFRMNACIAMALKTADAIITTHGRGISYDRASV